MGIVAALCVALLLSLLFSRRRPFGSLALFFFILFIASLAGHFWITPFGPVWLGVSWLPILFVGIIIAFLLMIPPPPSRSTIRTSNSAAAREADTAVAAGVFVWLLLLVLIAAAASGYYYHYNRIDAPRETKVTDANANDL